MKKTKSNKNSTVLIGLQYGDEGKGRVMDKILSKYNIAVRFNGGANAGHTLKVGNKEIALHQIPSGIFHKKLQLYIGSGCVINPKKTNKEIADIKKLGISLKNRLKIAANATLIQPHQILLDQIYGKGIGTTGNGIGPAYADRALRTTHILKNLRVCDFFVNPLKATKIVEANVNETIKAHKLKNINAKKIASDFKKQAMKLKEYYCPDPLYLEKQVRKGKKVFFEGAQSVMLDVSTGSVPFVTSSRTIAAAAYTGGDTSNRTHKNTIGVGKAIMSRVGNGPFISEFGRSKSEKYCAEEGGYKNIREVESKKYNMKTLLKSPDPFKIGIALRLLGFEYGATTKRPRRIGMLDLVMLKQNCMLNGVDELYLNKFDCLTDYNKTSLPGIPVVTAYKLKGKKIDYIPTTPKEAEAAIPVVKYLPHIKKDISKIRDFNLLPTAAKKLVKFIEKQVGTPLYGIGVGPERDQFIQIKK